ncbi:hypothetical protein [Pseudorhodoferax sp. Leaf267]|uniref:hypothetical protein n=1 Tax=Pseudorhodoferax sp. Leaf267 TaxID=1736316 RepID=UPI0012E1E13B|nr:hypothetical protein [Pseudorhodoferax sp. Leaf267]
MSTTYPPSADRMPRMDRPVDVLSNLRSRVSWGAVFAGVVIAIVVQMVLSLLGAGIGLSTVDPLRHSSPDMASFGMGAGIWWAISSVISLFAGGWVAAHLAGSPEKSDAMLHGLLTWGLAAIVTAYLLASAVGAVVRGGANVVGTAATVTASGAAAVAGPAAEMAKKQLEASGISWDSIKAQAQELLKQTGKPALQPGALEDKAEAATEEAKAAAANAGAAGSTQAAGGDIQAAIQKIIDSGKDTVDQVDRDAVVNIVMARSGATRPEAEARVDGWIKTYQDARVKYQEQKAAAEAKAREVADATAKASSQAALATVAALVLGGIAAALGGLAARRRYLVAVPRTVA